MGRPVLLSAVTPRDHAADIWNVAQSTLNLTTAELQSFVARFCGMSSTTYSSLSASEQAEVDRFVRAGLRRFYAPPPLPGEKVGHQWSFLSPRGSILTVADQVAYDLPDDFGGMLEGSLTWPSDHADWEPVRIVSDSVFRKAMQQNETGARTRIATILPKSDEDDTNADGVPDIPTAFEILLYPAPQDDDIVLSFRYYCIQDAVTSGINPPGGALHADTIIAACRYAASELAEPKMVQTHQAVFMERLSASVAIDRRTTSVTTYGYNGDRSDTPWLRKPYPNVTVNGVQY